MIAVAITKRLEQRSSAIAFFSSEWDLKST
jgi:hypothetical protein